MSLVQVVKLASTISGGHVAMPPTIKVQTDVLGGSVVAGRHVALIAHHDIFTLATRLNDHMPGDVLTLMPLRSRSNGWSVNWWQQHATLDMLGEMLGQV